MSIINDPVAREVELLTDWETVVDPAIKDALLKEKFTNLTPENGQVVKLSLISTISAIDLLSASSPEEQKALLMARAMETFKEVASDLQALGANCKIIGHFSLPSIMSQGVHRLEKTSLVFVFPVIEKTDKDLLALDIKTLKLDI